MKVNGRPRTANPSLKRPPAQSSTPPSAETVSSDGFEKTSQATREPVIVGEQTLSGSQQEFIRRTIGRAVDFFEEHYAKLQRPLTLNVDDTNRALRTSYSIEDDVINFPADDKGERPALESADIITHEAFHAMLAQAYPQWVEGDFANKREYVRLHEGLADHFTHLLYPDDHFAEGLGENGKPLRDYRNSRRISLSPGGHSQGNALTSYLLKNEIGPRQVGNFLAGPEFTLEALGKVSPRLTEDLKQDAALDIPESIFNYPDSSLRRYRISHDVALGITFAPNESLQQAHPELQIDWIKPTGIPSKLFLFEETAPHEFQVRPGSADGVEKVLALFRDGEEIIGSRPFYFGTAD